MFNLLVKSTTIGIILFVLSACDYGYTSAKDNLVSYVKTGFFIDSPVDGLTYETPSFKGVTDKNGSFKYQEGENVKFYLGTYYLGEAKGASIATPYHLYPNDENAALQVARVLQTLDADNDPSNGITLVNQEQFSNLDSSIQPSDQTFETELNNALGLTLTVSKENAKRHLDQTISDTNGDSIPFDRSVVHTVKLRELAQKEGLTAKAYLKAQFETSRPNSFVQSDTNIFDYWSTAEAQYLHNNWAGQFDFSGIGWDAPNAGTLVTNQHIIVANHYVRGINQRIIFYAQDGTRVERHVIALKTLGKYDSRLKDACVEKLNEPVPEGVKIFPLLDSTDLGNPSDLVGAPYLMTDKTKHVFAEEVTHFNISSSFPQSISFWKSSDNTIPSFMFHSAVSGDSGNPQFFIVNGELVLSGVLYGYEGGNMINDFYGYKSAYDSLVQAISDMEDIH